MTDLFPMFLRKTHMERSCQWHQESLRIEIERARLVESCSCYWLRSARTGRSLHVLTDTDKRQSAKRS